MNEPRRPDGADDADPLVPDPLVPDPLVPDQRVPEIEVEALRERLAGGAGPAARVVDVREDWEWARGHIAGATHIPLGQLPMRLSELDGAHDLYFICHLGARSEMAARFARQQGLRGAVNVRGGIDAWESRGYPVTTEP